MAYIDGIRMTRALTEDEQDRLLRVTGEHARGFRDHMIISIALATALREHEILALNVGDVFGPDSKVRRRVVLRVFKWSNRDQSMQEVFLSDSLRRKLGKFHGWKKRKGESLDDAAPLFLSRLNRRLSDRRLREVFFLWQSKAGFDRKLGFHCLRHSALTNLYRGTRDLRLTQRVARHKSILSTVRYAGPTDEEVVQAVQSLRC